MHHLSIDLETFSSVPIKKAGAQKYISSPDFEILLFAYSLDGAPVEVIDLTTGAHLPPWLVQAITSPEFIKHAYNAPFEWGCLSKFLGWLPPEQWRCSMFHGLYDKVFIHYLIVQGCEDEDVMATIRDRADTHEAVMQALKARIKKIKEERIA